MPQDIIIEQADIIHLEDDPTLVPINPGIMYHPQDMILREVINIFQYLTPANQKLVKLALTQTEVKDIE